MTREAKDQIPLDKLEIFNFKLKTPPFAVSVFAPCLSVTEVLYLAFVVSFHLLIARTTPLTTINLNSDSRVVQKYRYRIISNA